MWPAKLMGLLVLAFASNVQALYDGMYCGKLNCYDVLNVTRETPKKEVGKVCRNVLRELHPDKVSGDADTLAEAKQRWDLYRTACETLRDDDSKKNYDYLLDNPDEFFRHWWYYHRPRVPRAQLDAGLVVIVLLSLISAMQYYFVNASFDRQVRYILSEDDKLLQKLLLRAEKEGHADLIKQKSGKNKSKDEQKQAILKLYGDEIGLDANLDRCYYSDVVWAKAFRALYKWPSVLYKWGRWTYRHVINDFEYDDDEKELMTRRKLMISERNWYRHTEEYRKNLVAKELWDEEKYRAYQDEQEEVFAEYVLREAEFKRYKREKKKQR